MDILTQLTGLDPSATDTAAATPLNILVALGLSFGLMLVIGAVYQSTHRGDKYSQDYVHMLIMLGMIVAVVIMGVAGNVGRAFGIFAAFSIIRFRRSVPAARDLAFIFFAMAVGLAVGGGEYALAVLTTVCVCAGVIVIARLDLFAPRRPSHLLYVRVTHDIDHTRAFTEVFGQLVDRYTLLGVESVQAGLMTELSYAVQLKDDVDPLTFVAEIQARNGNNRVTLRTYEVEDGVGDD